jgi:hypothetical protein
MCQRAHLVVLVNDLQPLLHVGQDFFVGQSASDSPNFVDVHVRVSHTVGLHCLLALRHDSVGSRDVAEGRVLVFHDLRPFEEQVPYDAVEQTGGRHGKQFGDR